MPSQSYINAHVKLTPKSPLSNFGNASSVVALPALTFCNPAVQVSRTPGADHIDRRIDHLYALLARGGPFARPSARLQALGFVYCRGFGIREEVDQRLGCNRLL